MAPDGPLTVLAISELSKSAFIYHSQLPELMLNPPIKSQNSRCCLRRQYAYSRWLEHVSCILECAEVNSKKHPRLPRQVAKLFLPPKYRKNLSDADGLLPQVPRCVSYMLPGDFRKVVYVAPGDRVLTRCAPNTWLKLLWVMQSYHLAPCRKNPPVSMNHKDRVCLALPSLRLRAVKDQSKTYAATRQTRTPCASQGSVLTQEPSFNWHPTSHQRRSAFPSGS